MDGVRHPVGPEPAATYWWRRVLVLALLALVVLVVVLLVHAVDGPQTVAAAPAAGASANPSKVTSTAGTSAPGTSTSGPSSPVPSRTAGPSPSKASTAPTTKKPTGPVLVACNPAQMQVALTGSKTLTAGRRTVFRLSMVNDGPGRCQATVQTKHFELKIYSGTDRIWSSKDCATALERIRQPLARGKALDWKMTWDGHRSAPDCQDRPGLPGPGTYVATAQLDGSRPVQLRMTMPG